MSETKPRIVPALFYEDADAAIDWLERAFGFEVLMRITDDDGAIQHAELGYHGHEMMVGPVQTMPDGWPAKSPRALGGANTQSLHVSVDDVDGHFERAKAAGAEVLAEPQDQFYGDRNYRVLDCEGHFWTFGQTVRVMEDEEIELPEGLRLEAGSS